MRSLQDNQQGLTTGPPELQGAFDHPILWETVLRQIPAGATVMEAHGGTILLRNHAAAEIMGLTDHEAMGSVPTDAVKIYSRDGSLIAQNDSPLMRVIRTGKSTRDEELIFERRDGTRVTVLMDTTPIYDSRGKVIAGVATFRDITGAKAAQADLLKMREDLENTVQHRTSQLRGSVSALRQEVAERLKTERALRDANELLERVFADVHLLVAYMDRDFNFIRVNRTYAQADQHDPEFFTGKNHFQLYPDRENERIFREVLRSGEPYFVVEKPFAYPGDPRQGTTYWDWSLQPVREADGAISGLVLTLINVTERRRTREALQAVESRYRLIVEEAARGIIITDGKTTILEANSSACRLLGRSASELVGHSLSELFDGGDLNYIRNATETVMSGKTVDWDRAIHRPDGSILYLEGSANLLLDGRALIIMRDVSSRKRAEVALRDYQTRLKTMASELVLVEEHERRRLAVDLHDRIGQALALCKLRLGQLGQSLPEGADRSLMEDTRKLLERAIDDTHTMSFELSPPVLHELGLVPAAEWLVDEFRRRYNITIDFQPGDVPSDLSEDIRTVLFRCLQEVLMNVVKHSRASSASVAIENEDHEVVMSVEDDGVGFEAEAGFAGTISPHPGFGLFSVRERMAHFGGRVTITSESGKGTRVVLSLPLDLSKRGSHGPKGA